MNKLLGAAAAAYAASGAALAQPELELFATTDAQVELVRKITELRAAGGFTSEGTVDPLRDLALLYESAGNQAFAIAALEEARHVTRVHQGLSSADEALLLQQQIRSEKALGDGERAWDLEQDMITIARQHHDDIRMLPVFRELAENRSDALEQYRAGKMPPEIYAGCYYVPDSRPYHDKRGGVYPPLGPGSAGSDGVGCRSGQSGSVIIRLRREILEYYADAIEVMLQNGDYASLELRDLEQQMFRASQAPGAWPRFMPSATGAGCRSRGRRIPVWAIDEMIAPEVFGSCLRPVIHDRSGTPIAANSTAWVNLVRLIAYETRGDAPTAGRANAIAELADWLLVFTPPDRRRYEESDEQALELYGRAYRELEPDDEARASIFFPAVPVTLPTYQPNPFGSAAAAESSRYIDVQFAVTQQGEGEQIAILGTSKGATRAEERNLVRLIERTTFRPRFIDGELAAAAPVVLRYHLHP